MVIINSSHHHPDIFDCSELAGQVAEANLGRPVGELGVSFHSPDLSPEQAGELCGGY